MALKHAGAWPSHPSCMEGSPGPQWGRMEQYRGSDTYLTDLFQGGDKEVITHYRQCIEHVHGLEERREGVKVRVMTPCKSRCNACHLPPSHLVHLLGPQTHHGCLPQGLYTCCSLCPEHVPPHQLGSILHVPQVPRLMSIKARGLGLPSLPFLFTPLILLCFS